MDKKMSSLKEASNFFKQISNKIVNPFFISVCFVLIIHHPRFILNLLGYRIGKTEYIEDYIRRYLDYEGLGLMLLWSIVAYVLVNIIVIGTRSFIIWRDYNIMPKITDKISSDLVVTRELHDSIVADKEKENQILLDEKKSKEEQLVRASEKIKSLEDNKSIHELERYKSEVESYFKTYNMTIGFKNNVKHLDNYLKGFKEFPEITEKTGNYFLDFCYYLYDINLTGDDTETQKFMSDMQQRADHNPNVGRFNFFIKTKTEEGKEIWEIEPELKRLVFIIKLMPKYSVLQILNQNERENSRERI